MDELTLMEELGAERVVPKPTARAAAREALEARMETAGAAGPEWTPVAATDADQPVASPLRIPTEHAGRRRGSGLLGRRRRILAFAGAVALAAILAGVLVLGSGPTAQPAAAAEVLHRTADVAAASDEPGLMPGPHQLLFEKNLRMELQEWNPEMTASYGGVIPRLTNSFAGQVTWSEEAWMSNKRWGRDRLVFDSAKFLHKSEGGRWKAAGSPLPGTFDGDTKPYKGMRPVHTTRGVWDVETLDGPGYGRFAGLPTDPTALRRAIEGRQKGQVIRGQVIAELWEILDKANARPALRAAVFNALAEEPGIALNRHATDMAGRHGFAVSYEDPGRKPTGYQQPGVKTEYIFDPKTSAVLGKRETLVHPSKRDSTRPLAAGTVFRDVAYLGAGIVDSTDERPMPARASGQ